MNMYSLEQYEKAFHLRDIGLTYKEIARELGIKYPGTVIGWVSKRIIPRGRFLNPNYKILTPKLSYVLGVIEGDGYVSIKKCGTKGNIGLEVKDKDFAEEFKRNLEKWSGLKVRSGFNKKKLYYSVLGSLRTSIFLREFNINTILNSNKKIKSSFLKGFFDAEGGVSGSNLKTPRTATRFISCFNTNYKLIIFIGKLLESLKIRVQNIDKRIGGFTGRTICYRLRVSGKENLQKFRDKIGFSIKRKNKKLKDVLDSYIR